MKKILIGLLINLAFIVSVSAGPAEDKYWDEYSKRLIDTRKICTEEANKSGSFNSEVFDECTDLADAYEKDLLQAVRAKDEKDCDSMKARINNSKARAKSNAGNFLLGMLERQMEDMACY